MNSEVFYPLKATADIIIVEVLEWTDDYVVVTDDLENEYTLKWWNQYGYYRGSVNELEGFIAS